MTVSYTCTRGTNDCNSSIDIEMLFSEKATAVAWLCVLADYVCQSVQRKLSYAMHACPGSLFYLYDTLPFFNRIKASKSSGS